jgi:hypothetical protein
MQVGGGHMLEHNIHNIKKGVDVLEVGYAVTNDAVQHFHEIELRDHDDGHLYVGPEWIWRSAEPYLYIPQRII